MNLLQPLAIGGVLALAVSVYASWIGLDRDRAFYTTVVAVVASYYVLFSVMGGGTSIIPEISIASIFIAVASLGFRRNMWLVAAALAGHGMLDAFHGSLVHNPGVPAWWPPFCLAYDLTAAGYLAMNLRRAPADSKVESASRPAA